LDDDSLIWDANQEFLHIEQHDILQPNVYDPNEALWKSWSTSAVMSKHLTSPVPGDSSTFPTAVPNGNIGNFDDRWNWIVNFQLPAWKTWDSQNDAAAIDPLLDNITNTHLF
jgi:hypothetical protein